MQILRPTQSSRWLIAAAVALTTFGASPAYSHQHVGGDRRHSHHCDVELARNAVDETMEFVRHLHLQILGIELTLPCPPHSPWASESAAGDTAEWASVVPDCEWNAADSPSLDSLVPIPASSPVEIISSVSSIGRVREAVLIPRPARALRSGVLVL
jgi:hypothetical protein